MATIKGLSHVKLSTCHAELDSASRCTALYNEIPDQVRNDKLFINMRQPLFIFNLQQSSCLTLAISQRLARVMQMRGAAQPVRLKRSQIYVGEPGAQQQSRYVAIAGHINA